MAPPKMTLASVLKTRLTLAAKRLGNMQEKDNAIAMQQRRALAVLMEKGKWESARIRVENIIRSDILSELNEIIGLYCQLLIARIGLIDAPPDILAPATSEVPVCHPDLEEAVKTIIYVAPQIAAKELREARDTLILIFGSKFAQKVKDESKTVIPERVLKRLRIQTPSPELVEGYLREIAKTYRIPWPKDDSEPDKKPGDDNDNPSNKQAATANSLVEPVSLPAENLSQVTPPIDPGPRSPISVALPHATSDNTSPKVKLPSPLESKPKYRNGSIGDHSDSVPRSLAPTTGKKEYKDETNSVQKPKLMNDDEMWRRFLALSNKP